MYSTKARKKEQYKKGRKKRLFRFFLVSLYWKFYILKYLFNKCDNGSSIASITPQLRNSPYHAANIPTSTTAAAKRSTTAAK